MKYELGFFEEFITKECRKNRRLSPNSIVPDFTKKKLLIENEAERIKKSLAEHVFQVDNESRIELFIQHHQAQIIRLADKVVTQINSEESSTIRAITPEHSKINLCKIVLLSFEGLLNYIEAYFSKYFDQDHKIPDAYAYISAQELEEQKKALSNLFNERKLDKNLSDIILFPIENFLANTNNGITFRRLIFLKYITKELSRLSDQPGNYTEAVFEHLFYLNFNNNHFLRFATNKIRVEVDKLASMAEQLEHLSLTLKKVNQAQVKPSFALKPEHDSVKNIFGAWLEEEIHFIEKRRQLTLMLPPGGVQVQNLSQFKVKTILSVPQLAYSIRLLKDSGIITNDNRSELIRFFSKNFSSHQVENISTESFKGDYFKFGRAAVTHVQGVLTKLLLHSKKDE